MEIKQKNLSNLENIPNKFFESIEIIIDGREVFFSWNHETIQWMAKELGEVDFPDSRPCG